MNLFDELKFVIIINGLQLLLSNNNRYKVTKTIERKLKSLKQTTNNILVEF